MTPNFFSSKMQYGYKKTQNLMRISNPLKSCTKTHEKKVINEKVTEKFIFLLFYCVQISAYISTFANVKAKIRRNGSKKRKKDFINVS
jgi:hypothetical protein